MMNALELKIPPPVVVLGVAGLMGVIARVTPSVAAPLSVRAAAAAALAVVGVGIGLAGIRAFRRANTTTHPFAPERSSALVTSGVYAVTRNPMYVGLLVVLVAWACLLANAWALVGPVAFVSYMTRFQIIPEERALAVRFGAAYADYRARIRRWL
jgi:protein-S-isoprenylcysteine O-methyltransferase Ste14